MAHGAASKKALRHGSVTVALTVLILAVIILLNAIVTSLALRFGWYINMNPTQHYPVTDTCYDYLDTYVIPETTEDIRIIFCDEEENLRADTTQSFILNTAEELVARYPDAVTIEYLNVWENPSIARGYGVTADTSVVVASGERHVVCTLRDFFVFSAGDTENPQAYNGEKRFAVAMKAVVTADAPMAYFTLNHGESFPDYALMYAITDAGYLISYLDALSFDIPEDCELLVTYNPIRDFTAEDGVSGISEIDKLDAYMSKGGRYMTFISADTFAAGGYANLEGYLKDWGVTFEHKTGAEGVEECYAIRDTAHAFTTDGYTVQGVIPPAATELLAGVEGSLRLANATAISVAEGYAEGTNGTYTAGTRTLTPLIRSFPGAEAWAGGRAADRSEEGFNLMTLTSDTATGGHVLVCTSTEFATEATLQSGVYANGRLLLTALGAMGKGDTPVHLTAKPFSNDTIHILTTAQARTITVALVAAPALISLAVGLFVLIRRKFA